MSQKFQRALTLSTFNFGPISTFLRSRMTKPRQLLYWIFFNMITPHRIGSKTTWRSWTINYKLLLKLLQRLLDSSQVTCFLTGFLKISLPDAALCHKTVQYENIWIWSPFTSLCYFHFSLFLLPVYFLHNFGLLQWFRPDDTHLLLIRTLHDTHLLVKPSLGRMY